VIYQAGMLCVSQSKFKSIVGIQQVFESDVSVD